MASIKAKLSSVELYTSQCGDDYSTILNIANDVLSRSEKLYIIVQEELEKISRQVNRVQRSYDDIQHKVTSYMQRMEDAAEEIDRCSEEISYIYSHPSTVTTTDDEGNETTEEVIDYDGIRAAERERDAARSTYNLYENKCDDARMVLREAGYTVSKFQNTKYGIEAVSRSIQNDIYEIKKYIRAIEDEAEFNIHSLQGVIDSLQSYLASKAIFMPEGSYYEEFASASVGGSSATKASASSAEGGTSNNNGAEVGKKIVGGVKTAIGVAAAAIASVVPSPADAPQKQYIDAMPQTEIARSIDHYNSGNPKQERLNQDYLELEERRKKEEGEITPNADVPAGAGGDVPKNELPYRIIEDEDGMPIAIEIYVKDSSSQHRTIPGTPGVVNVKVNSEGKTVGNSTELSRNLWKSFDPVPLESYDSPDDLPQKAKGYQAQHIIPVELHNHPVLQKIGMEMNDASNGIFLPEPDGHGHALTTHKGYHAVYNNVCEEYLDKIYAKHGSDASVAAVEADVAKFQRALRTVLEDGVPIYRRKANADQLDVSERGGGATEELLRKAIDRRFQL